MTAQVAGLATSVSGPDDGPPLVLLHTLGTDRLIWKGILPLLPRGLRVITLDLPGHGASTDAQPVGSMGGLIGQTEAVLDQIKARDAIVVGLGSGGMIAQGLAVKRLDLVRGLVLCGTAARLGTKARWQTHIAEVRRDGLRQHAERIADQWFAKGHSPHAPQWTDRLARMPAEGYACACAAVAGTDFYTTTASLRLPAIGLVGREDRVTPPDLVRETVELIPGAEMILIPRAGHLACVEQPQAFANALTAFCDRLGHL